MSFEYDKYIKSDTNKYWYILGSKVLERNTNLILWNTKESLPYLRWNESMKQCVKMKLLSGVRGCTTLEEITDSNIKGMCVCVHAHMLQDIDHSHTPKCAENLSGIADNLQNVL
jgi:hypothetical protein